MRCTTAFGALAAIAAFAFVASPAIAQTQSVFEEYTREQKKGIDAIGAKKYDDGLAAFKRCLELLPKDPTSAYNCGCVHSLKNELDPSIDWLGKAVDWGFGGLVKDEFQLIETKDTDLENVRKDARFAPLLERLKARRKAVAEFAAKPEIYVPEALKEAASVPLLVVLHDAGQTKATALEKGPWKRLADELGTALLIPSGLCLVESEPAAGMRWFDYAFAYGDKPWIYEKSVSDAVDLFKKSHKVDPARMFIAGQGQGGMVAFNVAICAPGSYKGVVVCASTILGGATTQARARTAAKAGMRAKLLEPDSGVYSPLLEPEKRDAELAALEKLFTQWAMTGGVERFTRKTDDADQEFNLVKAALQSFVPAPEPKEEQDEKGDKGDKDGDGE